MSQPSNADLVHVLKALGDKSRWQICRILLGTEVCVGDLVEKLGISQPLVSHHLKALRLAGLVRTRRQGNWVFYSLAPAKFDQMILQLKRDFGELNGSRTASGSEDSSRRVCDA